MALETPISAWQPPIAAEMVAPFLNRLPDHPRREQERLDGRLARLVEADAVQQHGRDHARRAVGRRRHHAAERRVLLVHRQGEAAHPLEHLGEPAARGGGWRRSRPRRRRSARRASASPSSVRLIPAARRTTPRPPGSVPAVWAPRKAQSRIVAQIRRSPASISSSVRAGAARSAGRPRGSSGPGPGSGPAGRRPCRSGRAGQARPRRRPIRRCPSWTTNPPPIE